MILYRRPGFQEPIGEVVGTDAEGFFAIPFGTVERVGPYATQNGATDFLVRDAGASAEFYVDGSLKMQLQ